MLGRAVLGTLVVLVASGLASPAATATPATIPFVTPVSGSPPSNAVQIGTNSNARAVVAALPPGTSFEISTGTHSGFSVEPKSDDRFYAAPGAVLNGLSVLPSAFSETRATAADDVVIVGPSKAEPLVIENYGNGQGAQIGAIQALPAKHAPAGLGSGWRLQWLDVTENGSRGVSITSGMTIYQCQVTANGRLGIGGGGTGVTIEGSVVSSNGVNATRKGFEAGGIKTVASQVVIAHNTIAGNGAPGVWTDDDATDVTIADNTIEGNQVGVQVEISDNVTVSGNVIAGSGQQGILVVASDRVAVVNNRVHGNAGGIVVGGVHRTGPGGVHLDQIVVRGNQVMDSGVTGLHQSVPPSVHVSFDGDHYTAERFVWEGQRVTFQQWQSLGQERSGTSTT